MHTRARIFFGILAAGLATTTAAWAANNGYHGSLCSPVTSADAGKLKFNGWGVANISTSVANVVCGASPTVSSNVTKVEVVVYDRDPAADVCCSIHIQKATGPVIASADRCSGGFGDAPQTLSYSPPVNAVGTLSMVCSIPPENPVNGASHVTSYRVASTP
jgi:hypothetical protein